MRNASDSNKGLTENKKNLFAFKGERSYAYIINLLFYSFSGLMKKEKLQSVGRFEER